jgi:flagellin
LKNLAIHKVLSAFFRLAGQQNPSPIRHPLIMNTGSKFEANQNTEVELDGTGTEGLDFQKVVLGAQEPAAGAAKAAVADAPEKPDFSGATALTFDDANGNGASADASGLNADAIQAALDAAAAADPTVTGGNITIELNQAGDGYELKAGNVLLGSTGNAANNSIIGADNAGTDKALVFTTADGTALGKSENIQAANSRIRDTDMAKMMMEYTKVNVVTQSAQAMLTQANQQPQSVLQLLQ